MSNISCYPCQKLALCGPHNVLPQYNSHWTFLGYLFSNFTRKNILFWWKVKTCSLNSYLNHFYLEQFYKKIKKFIRLLKEIYKREHTWIKDIFIDNFKLVEHVCNIMIMYRHKLKLIWTISCYLCLKYLLS